METRADGQRVMDNIRIGDSSIANQGNVDAFQYHSPSFHAGPSANQRNYHANNQTNTHNYYDTTLPGKASPQAACVRVGLPTRNANRVERKGLLEELERMLPSGKEHEPVALWGVPGSGKTQLALHYAHRRFSASKCSIFWVHAQDEEIFINNFKMISRRAGLGTPSDDSEMLLNVREWIESQPTWVVVIDGADDVELFTWNSSDRVKFRDFIPEGPNGTVIWTSQDRRILEAVGWARGLRVGPMTPDEAVSLLEITANHGQPFSSTEATHRLVRALGHNPLVISHVATTMRAHFTPEEMLSRLSDPHQRDDILEAPQIDSRTPQGKPRSVLSLLSGQLERLASRDPEAYRIIAMIAYMDRHAIPLDIFLDVDGHRGDGPMRRAIVRLKDLSLVLDNLADVESSTCNPDELMQEAIRYHIGQKLTTKNVSKVSGGPRDQANSSEHVCFRGQAVAALSRRFPRTIYYDTLHLCKPLVEHMVKVSQWAGSQCDALVETADLLIQAGDYLLFCGRWREMMTPYQRALEFRRKSLGAGDPRTIAAMDSLAHAHMKLGDYRLALELFTEACQLRTKRLGLPETHPDVMTSNMNIGVTYRVLGRLFLADTLFTKTLTLQMETLGDDHPDSAQSMYEYARLYEAQLYEAQLYEAQLYEAQLDNAQLDNAQLDNVKGVRGMGTELLTELLTESLNIQKRHLGDDHPKTMETKMHLGSHSDLIGDAMNGRRLHEEVLELQQRLLGRLHPFSLETKRLMSITSYSNDDQQKKFQTLSETVADSEATLGRSNPLTLRALGDLARQLSIRGDYAAAADIQRESLDVYSHQLGETHIVTLCVQLDLASLYLSQGRAGDSKALATAVCDALSTKHGEGASINKAVESMQPTTKKQDPTVRSAEEQNRKVQVGRAEIRTRDLVRILLVEGIAKIMTI